MAKTRGGDMSEGHRRRIELFKKFKPYIIGISIIFLWLFSGTLFYNQYIGWTAAQSFYFVIQSGLSIGFGAADTSCGSSANVTDDGPIDNDGCRWFALFNVFIGSSVVTAALGLFLDASISSNKKELLDHVTLVKNAGVVAPGEKAVKEKRHLNLGAGGLIISKLNNIDNPAILISSITIIITGLVFAMVHLEWNFIRALLYSVSAISTGGLEAPPDTTSALWFTAWFSLVGVPIYAVFVSTLATRIASLKQAADQKRRLKEFTPNDIKVLLALDDDTEVNTDNDEWRKHVSIDLNEFIQYYFLKLELATPQLINTIKNRFYEIDCDGSEEISFLELLVELEQTKADFDGDNELDFGEFKRVVQSLSENEDLESIIEPEIWNNFLDLVGHESKLKAAFLAADADSDKQEVASENPEKQQHLISCRGTIDAEIKIHENAIKQLLKEKAKFVLLPEAHKDKSAWVSEEDTTLDQLEFFTFIKHTLEPEEPEDERPNLKITAV
eukprot:m.76481 g.76481  ORF g.76481 m.76481 type:complete len:500 (+) comp24901_c0_seq1:216-1715(+)